MKGLIDADLGLHAENIVYAYKQIRSHITCQHYAKSNEFFISIILGITGYFIIIDGDKHGFGQDKPHYEL